MIDYNIRRGNIVRIEGEVESFVVVKKTFNFRSLSGYVEFICVYLEFMNNKTQCDKLKFYINEFKSRISSFMSENAIYKENESIVEYQKRVSDIYDDKVELERIVPIYELGVNLKEYIEQENADNWIFVYPEETCSKEDLELIFDEGWLKQINGFSFDNNAVVGKQYINQMNYHVDAINSLKILVSEISRLRCSCSFSQKEMEWFDEESIKTALDYSDFIIRRIKNIWVKE